MIVTSCSCTGSCKCHLKGGNCRYENIVYKGLRLKQGFTSVCAQLTSRQANHKTSFKCGIYENDTELSKCICRLKWKNIDHKITWQDSNNPIFCFCIKELSAVVFAQKDGGRLDTISKKNIYIFLILKITITFSFESMLIRKSYHFYSAEIIF